MMTKGEAIDLCMEVRDYLTSGNLMWNKEEVGEALDMAIEAFKAEQRWIPCSERLPNIGDSGVSDMVLLCWSDGQITVGAYQGNRTFVGQAWPKARDCKVTVTAWMPLPTLYKGGDDE